MQQSITIKYIPLIKGNISHVKTLKVSNEMLYGMMTLIDLFPDIISIDKHITIPKSRTYKYSVNLYGHTIEFNSMEFLQGISQISLLLGINPSSIINNVGRSNKIDFQRYFSSFSIPNLTEEQNGTAIDLNYLLDIISEDLVDSISKLLNQCFPNVNSGIIIPSDIYMITTDEQSINSIALTAITSYLPEPLSKYVGSYYIYNVCVLNNYKGQGLSKSLMISMLNDYINKGINRFLLEVLPTNIVAYELYKSLGFKKIDTTVDDTGTYDVLLLSFE